MRCADKLKRQKNSAGCLSQRERRIAEESPERGRQTIGGLFLCALLSLRNSVPPSATSRNCCYVGARTARLRWRCADRPIPSNITCTACSESSNCLSASFALNESASLCCSMIGGTSWESIAKRVSISGMNRGKLPASSDFRNRTEQIRVRGGP